ncbi:hypothetical protein ACFRAU_07105 [Arthrobacter sp. NPDC056691]|uniref:hypothetical protein n=1 Tax=Arthrobacter sp. NPDC056691 TaxID=3345913 RepID=UPI00366D2B59
MAELMPAASTLPDLWLDWCAVTGTPADQHDQSTLELFRRQACPSRALRHSLEPRAGKPAAPAWPFHLRPGDTALTRIIRGGSSHIGNPDVDWISRLRLRRLLFAAVLIAPASLGGLGLDRRGIRSLTPDGLLDLRPRIGRADDQAACPACAAWSWLEILGTNSGWSRGSVRALGRAFDGPTDGVHRHELADPRPEWLDWPDQANLLPSIDRWGYLDPYASMHPSSLSNLIRTMVATAGAPVVERQQTEPNPAPPVRHISQEEEAAILRRADELNARIARLLDEFS